PLEERAVRDAIGLVDLGRDLAPNAQLDEPLLPLERQPLVGVAEGNERREGRVADDVDAHLLDALADHGEGPVEDPTLEGRIREASGLREGSRAGLTLQVAAGLVEA